MMSMLHGAHDTGAPPPNPVANEVVRRVQLRHLDGLLGELEALNLRDAQVLPDDLSRRLRQAGVGHRADAPISDVIDLVFTAQEAFLQPIPSVSGHGTRRRSAA